MKKSMKKSKTKHKANKFKLILFLVFGSKCLLFFQVYHCTNIE